MDDAIITQGGLATVPEIASATDYFADINLEQKSSSNSSKDVADAAECELVPMQNKGFDVEEYVLEYFDLDEDTSWSDFLKKLPKILKKVPDFLEDLTDVIKFYRKLKGVFEGSGAEQYLAQVIPGVNGLDDVINILTDADKLDKYMSGDFDWKVSFDDLDDIDLDKVNWTEVETIVGKISDIVQSNNNGMPDIFFCSAVNKFWDATYAAQHLGVKGGWEGTGEIVSLEGKNLLTRIIYGSQKDLNALLLNDNSSGDALFLEDIFSQNGNQQRLKHIDEIQAGAGDDIIDLTSQIFAYDAKNELTIRGGNGDDVIWANCGHNIIFGDKGNDRIIGGKDNDTIIGGAGDDSMHGGGGNDTFCFGGNWGNDTVEQLADGKVTLWIENGSATNWHAETMTYSDGFNSIKVTGITADQVNFNFSSSGAVDKAFADFSSEKVYGKDNILNMIVG